MNKTNIFSGIIVAYTWHARKGYEILKHLHKYHNASLYTHSLNFILLNSIPFWESVYVQQFMWPCQKFQRNLVIFLIQNLTLTPNQIKSNQIKSNQIKSNQIRSNQIKSNQIKSNLTVILILILFQLKSNNTKRFFDAMT